MRRQPAGLPFIVSMTVNGVGMNPLEWLNSEAIHLLGTAVSWAEVLGDVTGLLSVWWAARVRVWTSPVGLVNSALFLVLFADARLYANAVLQFGFIVLGMYGWWSWLRRDRETDALLRPIRRTAGGEWLVLASCALVAQAAITTALASWTDSPAPFWDSLVLVLSLVATFGQARRLIESWWVWIAVDAVAVPLYASQGLYPTAVLYVVFAVVCIVGLRTWSSTMKLDTSRPEVTAA